MTYTHVPNINDAFNDLTDPSESIYTDQTYLGSNAYSWYDKLLTPHSPLNAPSLPIGGIISVVGYHLSGKTCLHEVFGFQQMPNIKIYIGDGFHLNRFTWAHVRVDTTLEDDTIHAQTLEELVAYGYITNVQTLEHVLRHEIQEVRYPQYLADTHLSLQPQLTIFCDTTDPSTILRYSHLYEPYRIQVLVSFTPAAYQAYTGPEAESFLLGQYAQEVWKDNHDVPLLQPGKGNYHKYQGCIHMLQGFEPKVVPVVPCSFYEDSYIVLNSAQCRGTQALTTWQRVQLGTVVTNIAPVRPLWHPDRHKKPQFAALEVPNLTLEYVTIDDVSVPKIDVNPKANLPKTLAHVQERLRSLGYSDSAVSEVLPKVLTHIRVEYANHPAILDSAHRWCQLHEDLFLEWCALVVKGARAEALSRKNLSIGTAPGSRELHLALLNSCFPATILGYQSLLRIQSLCCLALEKLLLSTSNRLSSVVLI